MDLFKLLIKQYIIVMAVCQITIYTDALRSYREVIGQTLGYKIDHVAKCGITKPHANNNRVERLNGTLRERVKVQRGLEN